jgi:hypothetical protein
MPNWTGNSITLRGKKESRDAFKLKAKGENGEFDFNRIKEMPKELDIVSGSETHKNPQAQENIRKYGYPTWYEWCRDNWGTKWNACEIEIEEYGNTLTYRFDTAWDCPRPLVGPIVELAQELGLSIIWTADHEDGGYEPIFDSEGEFREAA